MFVKHSDPKRYSNHGRLAGEQQGAHFAGVSRQMGCEGEDKGNLRTPPGVSLKKWEKHIIRALEKDQAKRHDKFLVQQETKVEKDCKRVSLDKVHPDSITEEMLDEDDNIPMRDEDEDPGEDTDRHLSTGSPTIHVHGGEAAMKADDDDEAAIE
ncbi:hypothetical protein FPANT_10715 [Fusarium pseudoanthophilum]|uniref:Uncharacterized protein n=1 Tax=Fusarium pseudoanthophilum TaxID=48495 RepID=A0A8H5KP72_9HYPO|nr:hypothetical protein FPANT_10715 [Fusarium pseudoanthophilum]